MSDEPDISTFFTPISITLNIDSFEHLEFETRPDQLLDLRAGPGRRAGGRGVRATGPADEDATQTPLQLEFDMGGYVQMELLGMDDRGDD